MIKKVTNFASEVRAEMQKVTWSTREELIGSTLVVLATMFILSSFIALADFVMSILVRVFLR